MVLVNSVYISILVIGQTSSVYKATVAYPNLSFNQPDGIFTDPTNSSRLFVIEQTGAIKVFNNSQTATNATVFLDLASKVLYGGEQGLLGLAFDPNYASNQFFYVNYVADNPRRTIIARYTTNLTDLNHADQASELIILEINQPYSNHKGGQIAFGPDGYLYIGVGDGGSEGDPNGNAQNLKTLLGKILRIDINQAAADKNYSIPTNNPFVNNSVGYRQEIFAYGFRNPWRFSFDTSTRQLWVGDVGQDRIEEIDIVESGKNYGWNIMEGTLCYNPAAGCNQTGLALPVFNYTHNVGNAIIGGYVYHGKANTDLDGAYIYGDYGSGRIWALQLNGTVPSSLQLTDSGLNVASFGLDQNGELYFSAYDGKIYKLTTSPHIPEFPGITAIIILLVAGAVIVLAVIITRKRRR